MARRSLLTGDERRRLFEPPVTDREVAQRYTLSPEELRWLEYGQRLITHERAVGITIAEPSVGRCLFEQTVAGIRNLVAAAPPGVELGASPRASLALAASTHSPAAARRTDQYRREAPSRST